MIIEGILYASHYGDMRTALCADHFGTTRLYYLHVPFEETLRRHATKPQAAEYGEAEMSAWYRELDLLPGGIEEVIHADMSLDDTVHRVMADVGLAGEPEAALSVSCIGLATFQVAVARLQPCRGILMATANKVHVLDCGAMSCDLTWLLLKPGRSIRPRAERDSPVEWYAPGMHRSRRSAGSPRARTRP